MSSKVLIRDTKNTMLYILGERNLSMGVDISYSEVKGAIKTAVVYMPKSIEVVDQKITDGLLLLTVTPSKLGKRKVKVVFWTTEGDQLIYSFYICVRPPESEL